MMSSCIEYIFVNRKNQADYQKNLHIDTVGRSQLLVLISDFLCFYTLDNKQRIIYCISADLCLLQLDIIKLFFSLIYILKTCNVYRHNFPGVYIIIFMTTCYKQTKIILKKQFLFTYSSLFPSLIIILSSFLFWALR